MNSVTPDVATRRLVRPEASVRRRHTRAALTVASILALAIGSLTLPSPWATTIALLAAGAGAGYSLSGSV